ncbi:hypothetical protein PTKIN_Ptkin16aG0094600 [Pterospermum kingtungense]
MATGRNDHWPQDLVTSILLRLPVKSILRFKCVSKTWRSLVENSSFVSLHLSFSKKVNNCLLVFHFDEEAGRTVVRLFDDQTLVSYQDLYPPIPRDFQYPPICVYDGLVCICEVLSSRISLWNPATRQFRLLPESIPLNSDHPTHEIGFGLDSFSNDYKVIFMQSYVDLDTGERCRHHAVYRMSTDSWRVLKAEDVDFFEDLKPYNNTSNACVNGVYYWLAYKEWEYTKVLAFHFSNEVFQLIDWPPVTDMHGMLLPLPDGRISLWISCSDTTNRSNDIWVLNEERQYWTKLLTIGPLVDIERMFGFWNKNDSKVFVESVTGQLLLYDRDTHEYRDIGIKTRWSLNFLEVYTYEESLLAVSRGEIE